MLDSIKHMSGIWGNISSNVMTRTLINNYWLSTCGAAGGFGAVNTGATPKTDVEIKALAATLGTAYTSDVGNVNNGFPILGITLNGITF